MRVYYIQTVWPIYLSYQYTTSPFVVVVVCWLNDDVMLPRALTQLLSFKNGDWWWSYLVDRMNKTKDYLVAYDNFMHYTQAGI